MSKYVNAAGLALMLVIGMGVAQADEMNTMDDGAGMHESMGDGGMMDKGMHGDMKSDATEGMMGDSMSEKKTMMSDDMNAADDKGMHDDAMDK